MYFSTMCRKWRIVMTMVIALVLSWPLSAQTIKVSGVVKDNTGEPLVGAIVVVQGKDAGSVKHSVTCDIDGKFTVDCLKDDIIKVHYLGYESLTEKVAGRTKIEFVLVPDAAQSLEESVVIGYGSVKKADLTGSVTNVKMGDIKNAPVSSIDQALQGRIAGADFMSTSGEPGASTSVRIRGTRSITASNEPLYVVDGVMDAINDLNDLNPNDVESVSVLKDASSTAIYGSRGSNGVIIITTKAGDDSKSSKPNINLKMDVGFSALPKKLDLMSGPEFALYRSDYYAYTNAQPEWAEIGMTTPVSSSIYKDPLNYEKGTDWIGEITRVAPYQNYNLSVSGGNSKTKYYASLGYNDNQGIIKKSGQSRVTGSFSIEHLLLKWLRVGYKLNYTFRRNDENLTSIGGTTWYSSAMYLSPALHPNDVENPLYYGSQRYNSPTALLEQNTYYTNRGMNTNTVFAQIEFSKYLKFRSQNTYYVFQRDRYRYYPSTLPKKTEGEGGDAYREAFNEVKMTSENTLSYDRTWSKTHHIDAVAGFTGYHYKCNSFSLTGSGYLNDSVLWNNMNAVVDKETYNASTSTTTINKMSGYARFNYHYKQRYYITFTGRADGSSNFAENKKWGFFPSGALKWKIVNEPWMNKSKKWVDDLSIRASFGVTGNDAISAYSSLERLSNTTSGYLFNGSQPVAYYPSRLASPDLTWEKTALYNLALDAEFLRKRICATLEFYYAKTDDLLLDIQIADQTGYSSRKTNIGQTTNKGIEFSLDTRNIVTKNFTWSSTFTISHNTQRVEDIGTEDFVKVYGSPGNNSFMMYGYVKGYPLNSLWGFKYMGVWHNQEEIDRNQVTHTYVSQTAALTKKEGAPKYLDIDHNGTLGQNDLQYLGNADPYLYGGLQNNFQYKNLKLGVYFTYSLGGKIYNYAELYMSGSTFTNQYRYMLDAWHPVRNPDSDYPRAGLISDVHVPSSFQVHDASYIRFKTLSLGYTFRFKKYIKDITVSAVGENLLLWKNYNGFDPDVSTESDGALIRRMDLGAYPKARTVVFSIQARY